MSNDHFTSEDYAHFETLLRAALQSQDEQRVKALLSNNINVILGALNDAVLNAPSSAT